MIKHFLDIASIRNKDLKDIIAISHSMKIELKKEDNLRPLEGKILAMIFDKPSTRTRISFDVGMRQLGGKTVVLEGVSSQLDRGETISDTAKVLSRYVDAIMIRTTDHQRLLELANHATVPVINGLTDETHPCQIMADIMTLEEHKGMLQDLVIAWTGDGNNVLNSLMEASVHFGYKLRVATPEPHKPSENYLNSARLKGAYIEYSTDPIWAVTNADCVITDTWESMGREGQETVMVGHNIFAPYQVNESLMAKAKKDAIFMHCLPAHRGQEVTDAVMDGPQSVVFDEAENRLHTQKGILVWCLDA
ncbi:ornithine carbamoyltransferase [Candidatus Endowatersipora endosymbiont of Watersipora subatra]|uniref:ornithine carbamoyltransferase n=1 Tax=Candidatus Endowatersipora endosymbiont of Watersipora subatra TaxID=3077946 RepID=UPI00312CB236